MKGKKKAKVDKETMCDDWCFVCKDGGSLYICEYKDCLKAYHAVCVKKDESFFESGGFLKCDWHTCHTCHKLSKYQCYCCPVAYCQKCIVDAEFAKIKKSKGFCINCSDVLLLGEEQKDVNSDGDEVDMNNRDTYECLLYEYWLAKVKGQNNLSLKDLHTAEKFFKSSERSEMNELISSPSESQKQAEDSLESTSEDSASEFSITPSNKRKRSKCQKSSRKTEVNSKRKEFVGWGSKPLIDFLVFMGKDTSKELSENDVVSIITGYIRDNKLFNPDKKKEILCDERLQALFGKKVFVRNSISNLLRLHFRENADFFEQDQMDYYSDEKCANENSASQKQKKTVASKNSEKKELVKKPLQSCFASIVMDNIKLVYLKKCLVIDLWKKPETFESKVIGSFVKVKSDPYDCMTNNPHQLVQVTGVKNASPGGKLEDILLEVSNRYNDFPISMLSDAKILEEECEELKEKVKTGQLRKLTIVELEEKAKSLHQLIMKHWIIEELKLLQNQMDRANEKGQRVEKFHYMERKGLLETEAEKKRLLEEVPKVIAEPICEETEQIHEDTNEELNHGKEIPLKPIENSTNLNKNWGYNLASSGDEAVAGDNYRSPNGVFISENYGNGTTKDQVPSKIQDSNEEESICNDKSDSIKKSELGQCGSPKQTASNDLEQKVIKTEVNVRIELSSDEDKKEPTGLEAETEEIWQCLGPYKKICGPFSILDLKKWGRMSPFALKCKVWNLGESEENGILLRDAVNQFYG